MMENYLPGAPKEVWLRQGDETNQIVIHAQTRDMVQGVVHLRGVSLFVYQKDHLGRPEFKRPRFRQRSSFQLNLDQRCALSGTTPLDNSLRRRLENDKVAQRLNQRPSVR